MERALQTDSILNQGGIVIRPFDQARDTWRILTQDNRQAWLYHSEKWIELLRRVYGLRIMVAELDSPASPSAACVLAQSRNPFVRRVVALPFSDICSPLGDFNEVSDLLRGLVGLRRQLGSIELRGVAAPEPWTQLDHFALWKLDLRKSLRTLELSLSKNFRHNIQKAARHGITVTHGAGDDLIERFYRLNVDSRHRLGLPAPPLRLFRTIGEIFKEDLDIWIGSNGDRDLVAVLLLSHGFRIHYKWLARASGETYGASHLVLWSVVEHSVGRFEELDLGRADRRNLGLSRFKHAIGAAPTPLPCSFFPHAPHLSSAEHLSGISLIATRAWKLLPLPLVRTIGGAIYGFLS